MNSIETIIEEYGQKIYKYCYNMLRNRQEAEDAAQDIFIKVYNNMSHMHEIKSVSSWLYRIAYNQCLNIIRRKKLFFFIPINEDLKINAVNYDTGIESEFSEQLTSIISLLPAQDRSVLILHVIEEKSYDEIAVIFNKKPDAVRKQYERARKKVKAYLEIERGVKTSEKVSIL